MAKKRRISRNSKNNSSTGLRRLVVIMINVVLFSILCSATFFLYKLSTNIFYLNLFFLMTILLGFISIAFFIALLVTIIARAIKRK